MFQTKFVEKLKTKFHFQNFFENHRAVYEIMLKEYGTIRQATCGNIKRSRKDAIKQTLTKCNNYCFMIDYFRLIS
jgi:transcription elongation factor Elf1